MAMEYYEFEGEGREAITCVFDACEAGNHRHCMGVLITTHDDVFICVCDCHKVAEGDSLLEREMRQHGKSN